VKTQTYFAFSMSDDAGDSIVEYVAGVDDFETAVATYWAPCDDGLLTGVRRGWPLPQPPRDCCRGSTAHFPANFQRTLRLTGFGLPWIPNCNLRPGRQMKRLLFAAAAFLCALSNGAHARDDRLPAEFVGDWCLAEHTADHLAFYHRGRCANAANVDDSLTISPDSFDAPEMHCRLLVARANKRGDYLAQFWCDDEMIQNYWFSLSRDRLYVSLTDREP
jgi:hypothetical protein